MDISFTPKRSSGSIILPSVETGRPDDAEHRRDARAVDVRVEQADARARALEREREVRRDGALADAALAAHHEHDVLHVGNGIFAGDVARDDARIPTQVDRVGPGGQSALR